MAETAHAEAAPTEPQARQVVYCSANLIPHSLFRAFLTLPAIRVEAINASLSTLSIDAQKRAQKDAAKKEAKAAASEAKEAEAKKAAMVIIKRVERNKRKYVTEVSGLEAHGMDLKKVAKEFGKKFATGSSVTKTASGGEEIVVQGDNSDDILDWVVDVAGVPDENVKCIEDKKKKSAG
ncbi:Translation machinery-associated protein 22 [Mycoblastus sanguinarius]|nr:Translation machinery-associated protein 22 [Mycoblastus sanguinarius]